MKSVPEQVWYSKALPVGDGSLKLRKLRNVALASRRLVGAGWTRSGRIVPVEDSVAPESSSKTTNKKKTKRWCGCMCTSNRFGNARFIVCNWCVIICNWW